VERYPAQLRFLLVRALVLRPLVLDRPGLQPLALD